MRWVGTILACLVTLFLSWPAHALTPPVIDPSIELDATSSVLVSSLYTKRGETFVELYNNTEHPINLSGWSLRFVSSTSESSVSLTAGWLLADSFVALSEQGLIPNVLSFSQLSMPTVDVISSVQVIGSDGITVSSVTNFSADLTTKWYQRKSSGLSGTFLNDFSAATSSTKLRHTPLYNSPSSPPVLRIVEIYPHASSCAPTDTSILCGDYVKLYNPSDKIGTTSGYRLRSDSSTSESSNAFHLDAYDDVLPGEYVTVSLRDDGDKLSLTDDGGWVWLEDEAGIMKYPETVTSYPSASSSTKVGFSWALAPDTSWRWTETPAPNAANSFPVPEVTASGEVLADVAACPQGKYRSPDTNRCRNIEDAIATLASCAEGQTRNPETNRCRSTAVTASVTLVPCAANQERNPLTNRCRASTDMPGSPTPCATGQERNPETNRCRKSALDIALLPAAIDPIKQSATTSNPLVLSLVGMATAGVVGYGLYEWRSEILTGLRRAVSRIGGK